MKLIAHRANINGPNKEMENKPEYILETIQQGYYVEIDVWVINNIIFLGHDSPQYQIMFDFLEENKIWIYAHAKNIDALKFLIEKDINCFFHNNDDCVLTLRGEIWTYPGKQLTPLSIAVMPEWYTRDWSSLKGIAGICSDYVGEMV